MSKRASAATSGELYLEDVLLQLRKYKAMADKALAQTSDEHLFASLDDETNSIALNLKHTAGNMRCGRSTEFDVSKKGGVYGIEGSLTGTQRIQ